MSSHAIQILFTFYLAAFSGYVNTEQHEKLDFGDLPTSYIKRACFTILISSFDAANVLVLLIYAIFSD